MTSVPQRLYRRRVVAIASGSEAVAAMEDDFHYFIVRLRHDGETVTAIEGVPVRVPWTSCPGAAARLQEMVGARLHPAKGEPRPRWDISQHCTHMFDIAKLAIAQAARASRGLSSRRRYDVTIPDRIDRRTTAEIRRDGDLVFRWDVEGLRVTGPAAFADHSLEGRAIWPDGSIADDDVLEAALILRRCLVIFRGRMPEPPTIKRADQVPGGFGSCFTYQPENAAHGEWVMEDKDYSASADLVLADLDARLRGVGFGVGPD